MKTENNEVVNIDVLKSFLKEELEKVEEPKQSPLVEIIISLKEEILAFRTKKISWQKIAEILKNGGLKVNAGMIATAFKDDPDFQKVKKFRKTKENS